MSIPWVTNAPVKPSRVRAVDVNVYEGSARTYLVSKKSTHLGIHHHESTPAFIRRRHILGPIEMRQGREPIRPDRALAFARRKE